MTKSARELGVMQGFPPPADKRVDRGNYEHPPFYRWAAQNMRLIMPTAAVYRGTGAVRDFAQAEQNLDDLQVTAIGGEGKTRFKQLLIDSYCDGIMILHRGRSIYERYFNDMQPHSLHISQSVGKSFTSTLVAILWGQGLLDLARPVEHYIPELKSSAYEGALLWQVLDMRSGIEFDESDYDNPLGVIRIFDRIWSGQPEAGEPTTMADLILTLKKVREHGTHFEYRSIETELLGWIIAKVAGEPLVEFMSRELWAPMGAAYDAAFAVDPNAFALTSGGLNAALSDYARFAQLFLEEGSYRGKQIVPAAWVAQCSQGDSATFASRQAYFSDCPGASYSRQWWALAPKRRRQVGLGIFGQILWIDPVDQLVVVKLSSEPQYINPASGLALRAAFEEIGRELNG